MIGLLKKYSEESKSLKSEVRSFHNQAEEVFEHAEENFANARLLRRGADRDLMQAKMTIEDLSSMLKVFEA